MEDLIEILEETLLPVEIVELLNELINNQYIIKLQEYAVDNDICPKCYGELSTYTFREDRGEHFGVPIKEEMHETRCKECGWVQE